MSPSRQRAVAIGCTAALFVLYSVVLLYERREWQRAGWSGLRFPIETRNDTERKVLGTAGLAIGTIGDVALNGPARAAGLQRRDRVVAINGISIADVDALERLGNRARAGDRVVYTVVRKGKQLAFPVVLRSPLANRDRVISLGVSVLVATIFLVIGLLLFWKKPGDLRALLFYLLSVGAASYFFLDWIDWEPTPLGFRRLTVAAEYRELAMTLAKGVARSLFAACLLHLSLIFPRSRPLLQQKPWTIGWVYGLPIALIGAGVLNVALGIVSHLTYGPRWSRDPVMNVVLGLASHELAPATTAVFAAVLAALIAIAIALFGRVRSLAKEEGWGPALLSRPATTIPAYLALGIAFGVAFLVGLQLADMPPAVVAYTALVTTLMPLFLSAVIWGFYPLLAAVAFFASYRDSGVEERQQVRWPLWGTIAAVVARFAIGSLGILFFTLFGREAAEQYELYEDALARTAYLLIPISFAFAILKYRLMEIDIIIKKTIVYTALSGVLIALYLGLVGGLGTLLVKTAGVEDTTVVVVSTLAIAALFVPVRNRIQAMIDRRLFRKRHEYPQTLRVLSHEIPKAADLPALLRMTAERLQQAVQSRNVVIAMRESESTFRPNAAVGIPDEVLKSARIESSGAFAEILVEPIAVERALLSVTAREAETLRAIQSALLVPIRQHRELFGFLSLGAKLSDEEYDLDDREFLAAVGDQLAVGLENLRLRREEREYETAREIQQGLLPREIPQVDGLEIAGMWQPARAVGGDYYDVLRLDDALVALCIGDVVGKGMPAALLMSSLQATVKAVAAPNVAPKDLCEKVKQVVCHSLSAGKFITFFYATVDARERRLVFTNAGHNPPLLMRPDGTVRRLEEGGTALGRMFRNAAYQQNEVALGVGDRVVLFTDGVTEARNGADEEFGEARLIALVAEHPAADAASLQREILRAVEQFTGGNFQDDVTLTILRVV